LPVARRFQAQVAATTLVGTNFGGAKALQKLSTSYPQAIHKLSTSSSKALPKLSLRSAGMSALPAVRVERF